MMTKVSGGAALPEPLVTLHRVFVATVAMAAIIIGLVAMHSAGMAHSDTPAATAVSHDLNGQAVEAASHHGATLATSAVPAAATHSGTTASHAPSEIPAAQPLLSCDETCAAECAMMALTCMVLFILSTLIFLGRFPAVLRRLVDRGRELVLIVPRAAAHIYSPSLTVLSISRT